MAMLIGSLTGPEFGIAAETAIILTDIEDSADSEEAEFEDAENNVVLMAVMPRPRTLTANYRIKTPASAPDFDARGHLISFADGNFAGKYIVTQVSVSKAEKGWLSGSLTARADSTWATSTATSV